MKAGAKRGFHRMGMVVLVPCLLISAVFLTASGLGFWLREWWHSSSIVSPSILEIVDPRHIPWHYLGTGAISLGFGLLWYGAVWAIGWIRDGFNSN